MGPDILRAVVSAGRESRVSADKMRARLERAWSGLSRAEQLALGGTLAAALAGGGMLVRSGLNARPLSIAEMRPMTTKDLLRLFGSSSERQKDDIARFCVCRVHDVRDELLGELGPHARNLLMRLVELLKRANPKWSFDPNRKDGLHAQIPFIERAVSDAGHDIFALYELYDDQKIWGEAKENAKQSGTDLEPFYNKLGAVLDSEEHMKARAPLLVERDRATVGSKERKNAEDSLRILWLNAVQDFDEYKNGEAPLRKEVLKIIWGREKITTNLAREIARVNQFGYHAEYGPIETWDVRDVTDMRFAFAPKPNDSDLPRKEGPFWTEKAKEPLDLSFWDTRNVESMVAAFKGYRGDVRVGMWDTRNVTNMAMTFMDAGDFNGDIANWDTSRVTDMTSMFSDAKTFDRDLSRWNMGSVVGCGSMFKGAGMESKENKMPEKARMAYVYVLEGSHNEHHVTFGQRGPADILRAVVAAGRESSVSAGEMRARLERAWSGLSRAEQLALGGTTLAAALAGGGLLLRSGLKAMARPLSIAEMRAKKTKHLLRLFGAGNARQQDEIAKFCVCRVHEVRDRLLDERLEPYARQLLSRLYEVKRVEMHKNNSSSSRAQLKFLHSALNALDKLDPRKVAKETQDVAEQNVDWMLGTTRDHTYRKDGDQESKRRYEDLHKKEIQRLLWAKDLLCALKEAIASVDNEGNHPEHGHIATWDVRAVDDMREAFKRKSFGLLDLSFWDTRNARNMYGMFASYKGEVEVGMWDTREVTDMGGMFNQALDFNSDIGNWDTSQVQNMIAMFHDATKFNRDIGKWDTSKVTHTSLMFHGATAFNQNLSAWKLSSVKDFREDTQLMFAGSGMEGDEGKKPEKVRSRPLENITLFGQPSLRSYV